MSKTVRLALWYLLLASVSPPAETAIDVASRKQLFTDYKFIQSAEGVSLAMNPPVRTGAILIEPDAPWEKNLSIGSYSSVVKENGRVRIWYEVLGRNHEPKANPDFMGVAYAESTDGVHFRKPVLGLVEFEGSRQNNLVLPADPKLMSIAGGSVMIDENPQCPPAERYKSWQKIYPKKGAGIKGPHRVWVSPDGLHWKLSERLVTGLRAADTQSTWFWDPRIRRYVGFTREWIQFPGEGHFRAASYNESDDMHTWEKMQIALEPDEADSAAAIRPLIDPAKMTVYRERILPAAPAATQSSPRERANENDPNADQVPPPGSAVDIYGPGVVPYTEAEGVHMSLMSMFHHWNETTGPDTADVRLGVSRDARHFQRPGARKPFLGLGPSDAFDSKWIWALPRPIRMGDELWIYYFGSSKDHSGRPAPAATQHSHGISRAVMRLDGFVAADFDYSGGSILTPPLRFQGSRLEFNLDTGAGGVGRVEILDERGGPIDGFRLQDADALNGNSVRTPASWRGKTDVSSLAGRVVRLHLKMRSARLYAFQFR
jgi:hypothetical protein